MSHFLVLNTIEENSIWIVFKRTAHTASCSSIRQQVVGIREQEHITGH